MDCLFKRMVTTTNCASYVIRLISIKTSNLCQCHTKYASESQIVSADGYPNMYITSIEGEKKWTGCS